MNDLYSHVKKLEDIVKCASVETELNIEQCIKQHLNILHDAEERDVSYLSFILCENGKDIRIERYADTHWFAVGLYTDMTNRFEEQLYNRLDAKNACEVIMMFYNNNRRKQEIKNKKRNCLINKILKLWHS